MCIIRRGFEMPDRPRPETVPPKPGTEPLEPSSQGNEEFARLLEDSFAPKFHQAGETVEGTIVAIGPEVAFVDVGGKGEATIDVAELARNCGASTRTSACACRSDVPGRRRPMISIQAEPSSGFGVDVSCAAMVIGTNRSCCRPP